MSGDDKKPADKIAGDSVVHAEQGAKKANETNNAIGGIGFVIWGLLWIGGTLFIKKDSKGNRM